MSHTSVTELQEKVADLQAKLLEQHPLIPSLLRTIHTQLRADPELVTLLSEEEIGVIVNGLKVQTATEIATSKPKAAATSISRQVKAAGSKSIDLF